MFITEAQLFELKYRLNGQYNGMPLAQIFLEELIRFNTGTSANHRLPLLDAIKPYLHRYITNKIIEVHFFDDSVLLIELNENDDWENCRILEAGLYKHIFDYERASSSKSS